MTVSDQEKALKLYDVQNFDVIHFIRLDFHPGECEFVSKVSNFSPILAIVELPGRNEENKEEQAAEEAKVDDEAGQGAIRLVKVE